MEKSEEIQRSAWIIGVDVSKDSIDACLVRNADGQILESKFHNNLSGFRRLKRWCKEVGCECDEHTLCCMEHTGLYTRLLVHYLVSREVKVWLESSFQITGQPSPADEVTSGAVHHRGRAQAI